MTMHMFIALLAVLSVAAVVTAAVFLILALIQLKRTAGEIELLAQKANAELEKVGCVTDAMSGFAGIVGGSTGRLVIGAAQAAFSLFRRFRRRKSEENDLPGGSPS